MVVTVQGCGDLLACPVRHTGLRRHDERHSRLNIYPSHLIPGTIRCCQSYHATPHPNLFRAAQLTQGGAALKLTPCWLFLLSAVMIVVGGFWYSASEENGGNMALPLIVSCTGAAIFPLMIVVVLAAVLYRALTGKRLQDIGGPAFLAAFLTAFGAGVVGSDGDESDGDAGGGGGIGGAGTGRVRVNPNPAPGPFFGPFTCWPEHPGHWRYSRHHIFGIWWRPALAPLQRLLSGFDASSGSPHNRPGERWTHMNGQVLDFSIQTNSGTILGDDGSRYDFTGAEWRERVNPSRGMRVDFVAEGGNAVAVHRAFETFPAAAGPAASLGPPGPAVKRSTCTQTATHCRHTSSPAYCWASACCWSSRSWCSPSTLTTPQLLARRSVTLSGNACPTPFRCCR